MLVQSAAIRIIEYEPRRLSLRVTFVSGARYAYAGVPDEVHRAFLDADSKGRFFLTEIRDRYPFRRLG
jgi:hypothetical protein